MTCLSCRVEMVRMTMMRKYWFCTRCYRALHDRPPSPKHPMVQLDRELRSLTK